MKKQVKNFLFKVRYQFRGAPFLINGEHFRIDESLRRWKTEGESWLFDHMKSCLRSGDDVIDVGANLGFMSLYSARLVTPGGRVVCFEPIVSHVRLLRKNLALNGLAEACQLAQCVVSDLPGNELEMVVADGGQDPTASIARGEFGGRSMRVKNIALDSYDFPAGFTPRLIKIDVEGAELSVLKSAPKLLEKYRPVLLIEVHTRLLPNFAATPEELYSYLGTFGYVEHSRREVPDSADGCYHVLLKSEASPFA